MSTSALQQDYISQSDKYHPFDDVARDHLKKKIKLTEYRDIDLKFNKNPNTNNLVVRKGDEAVKQSIKNIILTNFGERIMRPNVGSGIQGLLFEPANQITEIRIKFSSVRDLQSSIQSDNGNESRGIEDRGSISIIVGTRSIR